MERIKYHIFRLTSAAPLILVLLLVICGRDFLPGNAQAETYPSLWESLDPDFSQALETALKKEFQGEYRQAVESKKAAFVVVDITDVQHPKVAGVNPDVMLYAASMPKIGILLGAFVKIESGEMSLDDQTRDELTRMIRKSSNEAATAVLKRVGIENLADILQSEKYRLYDPKHNGGLWVGRDYSGGPVWKRDPLHNISMILPGSCPTREFSINSSRASKNRIPMPEFIANQAPGKSFMPTAVSSSTKRAGIDTSSWPWLSIQREPMD
jgi:hypothetical protein